MIVGVLPDATKEWVAVHQGVPESKQSWLECLGARCLDYEAKRLVGNGALRLWSALRETMPGAQEQRCTVHKTMKVLNTLMKKLPPIVKGLLHRIFDAADKQETKHELLNFQKSYADAYPRAWSVSIKIASRYCSFTAIPLERPALDQCD